MSLALIQGYSSAEEEEEDQRRITPSSSLSDDDGDEEDSNDDEDTGGGGVRNRSRRQNPSLDLSKPPSNSSLPSALDVFAQVTGPPGYLSSYVAAEEEPGDAPGVINVKRRKKHGRDKKDLPAGPVLESKAQLVGIRDRVSSDVEGSHSTPGAVSTTPPEGKRVFSASNPNAEDAAELLRMCLQCGIPKTYSHTKGMVCPVCADRPPADPSKESDKKKGSAIKDKEKSKRMRGQSSHATWKSETEMQLRQQFD